MFMLFFLNLLQVPACHRQPCSRHKKNPNSVQDQAARSERMALSFLPTAGISMP
jgi:hypothetical protein